LPGKLPFGGERKGPYSRDLDLEGAAPLATIRTLTKFTECARAPMGRDAQWRLISHLSLNYLSLCDGGREAFQEFLRLYDFSGRAAARQQIAGIKNIASRRIVRRAGSVPWNGVCRGLEVTIEFDEDCYVGGGAFLFASVLENFLGHYTGINSFTEFVATSQQRERPMRRWAPRCGEQILL
jgi:type VI secretion system protein ImpG